MAASPNIGHIEQLFMAMADATRIRLLNLMNHGEVSVNSFTEILGDSQPKISRHLAYLRRSGLVATRRDGKRIFYRLKEDRNKEISNMVAAILNGIAVSKPLAADITKLKKTEKLSDTFVEVPQRFKLDPEEDRTAFDEPDLVENGSPNEEFDEIDDNGFDSTETQENIEPKIERRAYNELEDFLL